MTDKILNRAKEIIKIESKAVLDQLKHLDKDFIRAVELIASSKGKLVIMGIGKSGIVGKKIAATFCSLGIPAMSTPPADLAHGDLGLLVSGDIVIILSYSGESEDLKKVLLILKNMNLKTIIMTGRSGSTLSRLCTLVLNVRVEKEACPFNLAPTASTTATIAMGDALALCSSSLRGFKKEDFAKYHPGGSLGKKLTLKVSELMHKGRGNPVVREDRTVREALFVMTGKKLGAASVINSKGMLVGYFTDGDLRRKLQKDKGLLDRDLRQVMTPNPKTITAEKLAAEAADLMQRYNCDNLPVVDSKGRAIGMIDERDLISAGLL